MERKKLEKWDKEYLWHPFTQMKEYKEEKPLIIKEGKGIFLTDIYGKKYIDGISSLWVNLWGHRRKEINQAIIKQLNKIAHSTLLGAANIPSIELAKKLVEITPDGLNKVFYSDSGSEAVEIALKICFQYWQQKGKTRKRKFIALREAYHGDTLGATSVGGIALFHKKFKPLLFSTYYISSPYCYRCPSGFSIEQSQKDEKEIEKKCGFICLNDLKKILSAKGNEIAALIIEPLVQAAGGIIVAPRGYLRRVSKICRKNKVLLIVDEVATGFGRTGRMFACKHEEINPDILCLAKGLTAGFLPLAATLTTDEIYNAFLGDHKEKKTFFHGHSYTGNQLASVAALANLKIFEKEKIIKQLKPKIAFLRNELKKFWELKHVGDIRQAGFIAGIELVEDKKKKKPYSFEKKIGWRVCQLTRQKGVLIRPLGDVIVIIPPLIISFQELKKLLSVIYHSIKNLTTNFSS